MSEKSVVWSLVWGVWLFVAKLLDSIIGLALIAEGVMLLFRFVRNEHRVALPIRFEAFHLSVIYPKQLIIVGTVSLVWALLCGILHDGVRSQGRLGILGVVILLAASAWGILCVGVVYALFNHNTFLRGM